MISLFRLTVAGLTAGWLCARSAAVEVALGETVFTVPDGHAYIPFDGPRFTREAPGAGPSPLCALRKAQRGVTRRPKLKSKEMITVYK